MPAVAPGNWLAWLVFQELAGGLTDGWGALSLASLEAGMRILGLPAASQWPILRKIKILILRKKPKSGADHGE